MKKMKYVKLFENFDSKESIKSTDLGTDFLNVAKKVFGDDLKMQDIKLRYRPSTDTGKQPEFTFSITIPSVGKEDYKGALLYTNFLSDGNSFVGYDNYSKNKEASSKEFNEVLIPAWKKASATVMNSVLQKPENLSNFTVGLGYKYEEKDLDTLKKYVSTIPTLKINNR